MMKSDRRHQPLDLAVPVQDFESELSSFESLWWMFETDLRNCIRAGLDLS
ncbi:hypothetical protein [Tardiphaga sp. P9-11]|nr:hypothetical protein [Tardiphaga sp. P9-11]